MVRLFATFVKIMLASLIAGTVLATLDIRASDLLGIAGLSPDAVFEYLIATADWAMANILLGAVVTVPVWILAYMFRPPRD